MSATLIVDRFYKANYVTREGEDSERALYTMKDQ